MGRITSREEAKFEAYVAEMDKVENPALCTEEDCDEPMGDNDRDLCAGCFDSWLSGQEDRPDYGGDYEAAVARDCKGAGRS